jgi:hypothetical protein
MQSYPTAQRVKLLNGLAGVLAYPAALGFAWLWLIEGQHRGLFGFALIWLLVAGVYIRVYAQFLRWWRQVHYSAVSIKARRTPSGSFVKSRRGPRNLQDKSLVDLEELAVGAGGAIAHTGGMPTGNAFAP